jgi:hypothetical protein
MVELRQAEESEVVLAFLQAEIDSPRWAKYYPVALAESGVNRTELIDRADLKDEAANGVRRALLGRVRGFGLNKLLFTGFPDDVQWRLVRLSAAELTILKYANCRPWNELSHGTRSVTDGAKDLAAMDAETKCSIKSIAEGVRACHTSPPLIAVESNDGFLVLVEGHRRATAYVAAGLRGNIDLLVGSSPGISGWQLY